MSSESIASPPSPVGAPEACRGCGAPLADDQRYCLECGERRTPMSSVLLGGAPASSAAPQGPPSAPPSAPSDDGGRGNAVTVIAGVGVLLLAMGIGVLIGRSSGSSTKQSTAPPQVITVASGGSSSPATGAAGTEATFSDDWPSATNGYTVQLQTLPVAGTQVSAVEAARSAASAKGAKEVGALKSEDFSSLPAGNYVIYSGVYHKRAEAQKALGGAKKSFPGASVVHVSGAGATSSSGAGASTPSTGASSPSTSGASGASSGSGASGSGGASHATPPTSGGGSSGAGGKSYEEKSKALPNVVSTG